MEHLRGREERRMRGGEDAEVFKRKGRKGK